MSTTAKGGNHGNEIPYDTTQSQEVLGQQRVPKQREKRISL